MKDFRQLKVWEKAHQLTLAIYHVAASFPTMTSYIFRVDAWKLRDIHKHVYYPVDFFSIGRNLQADGNMANGLASIIVSGL